MRALLVLSLAALLLAPATHAAPARPSLDPTDGLLLRADDDGGMTILLHVEDAPGGAVAVTPILLPPQGPARELGTYTRAYVAANGAPTVAIGLYAVANATGGAVRVPTLLVENARTSDALVAALVESVGLALAGVDHASPFAQELLLPELAEHFGSSPDASRFSRFRDEPTVYLWTAHRADVWVGSYLAREGSVALDAEGRVAAARALAEVGAASRVADETTRVAGAYVEETYDGTPGAQRDMVTAGTVAAGARTPLASLVLDDTRAGPTLAEPADQRTRATVGVHAAGSFVPLLGVETTQVVRPSPRGSDVTRITSVGAYAPGYVPAAGFRYHSDTANLLDTLVEFALAGPGSPTLGDFELDAGAFPAGAYEPAAGVVHRTHFREARAAYVSMIAAGAYTPLGFSPLAALTYDGSLPLVAWLGAMLAGEADGEEWLIATGTVAAGSYVPLVGVEARGRAPLQERAEGYEARLGVFAGSYRAFVPLVSLGYDGDAPPAAHALAFASGGTLGSEMGAFDVRIGTYAAGEYVGLAGLRAQSEAEGDWSNETLLVAGAYVADEFVPLAGVLYQGDDDALGSLGDLDDLEDDEEARLAVGVFVEGRWTPLVTVRNSGEGVLVTPAG